MYNKQEKAQTQPSTQPSVAIAAPKLAKRPGLAKLLRQHERLKEKRNPMFERNRFVKYLVYFMMLYYAGCLIMLGVTLPKPMGEVYHGVAAFHVLDGWFFVLLIADFWLRFVIQDTPANQTRPYSLLPISRNFLLFRYMRRAGLAWGNLIWGFFLVPFGIQSVLPAAGVLGLIGWLLGWWLLFVMNSYIYLLVRALCTRSMCWILTPIIAHAGLVCLAIFTSPNVLDEPCTNFMYAFVLWHIWPIAVMAVVIAFWFWLNVRVQGSILYDEVGNKEDVTIGKGAQMNFLNRFGVLGEYLKLEFKMKMRNRPLRIQFFVLLGCMLLFSGLLYFTNIYDGAFMTRFICLYDYIVPGMSSLVTIMCYEGNYIDMLMSRRESILTLMKAKYFFNVVMLLIPLILLTPLTISGKISIWMNMGYFFFTIGVLYPLLFQMSAYNKETLPLNAKLGTRAGNMAQNIITMLIMFLPILIERACVGLLGDPIGYMILIGLGVIGIVTTPIWLRYTYRRFMKRRYTNMEGFRATRKC